MTNYIAVFLSLAVLVVFVVLYLGVVEFSYYHIEKYYTKTVQKKTPQYLICKSICKPFKPKDLFPDCPELEKIGYIKRNSKDYLDLKENCFDQRTNECKYILTGISKIGKSTLVTQELKNQSFVFYFDFKSSKGKEKDLELFHKASGIKKETIIDFLIEFETFIKKKLDVLFIIEDIKKDRFEKTQSSCSKLTG